jgi:hypothetical protein
MEKNIMADYFESFSFIVPMMEAQADNVITLLNAAKDALNETYGAYAETDNKELPEFPVAHMQNCITGELKRSTYLNQQAIALMQVDLTALMVVLLREADIYTSVKEDWLQEVNPLEQIEYDSLADGLRIYDDQGGNASIAASLTTWVLAHLESDLMVNFIYTSMYNKPVPDTTTGVAFSCTQHKWECYSLTCWCAEQQRKHAVALAVEKRVDNLDMASLHDFAEAYLLSQELLAE